jgi:hypothetical protein
VGEEAASARDREDHAAKFAQQAVPHFDRHARTATHFGKDFEQADLAVRGQFNGLAYGIDEPAKDNFEGAPTGVPLEELFQGDDFATALRVGGVVGAEGFVNGVEKNAPDAVGAGRATLGESNEVVDIHIGGGKGGGGRVLNWRGALPDRGRCSGKGRWGRLQEAGCRRGLDCATDRGPSAAGYSGMGAVARLPEGPWRRDQPRWKPATEPGEGNRRRTAKGGPAVEP